MASRLSSWAPFPRRFLIIDGKPESDKYGWDKRDGHHLWTSSIDVARKYILAGGGESLETLVVGEHMFKMKRDGDGLINDFVEHCPNVTSLSIAEKGSSWVSAFGKQLVKLELRTDFPIEFPVYPTKLRVQQNYGGESDRA